MDKPPASRDNSDAPAQRPEAVVTAAVTAMATTPPVSEPARRALAEAATRRTLAAATVRPAEQGGRSGPEPVRYGDWEVKGLATDF